MWFLKPLLLWQYTAGKDGRMRCLMRNGRGQELVAEAKFDHNILFIQHQQLQTRLDISLPTVQITRESNSQVVIDKDTGISITIDNDEIPVEFNEQLIMYNPQGLQLYYRLDAVHEKE